MEAEVMPRIILKETVTKEIDIPIKTLYKLVDTLSEGEKAKLSKRLKTSPVKLEPFKKDKVASIISDFKETNLYEDDFLKDLEQGLKKSSIYK